MKRTIALLLTFTLLLSLFQLTVLAKEGDRELSACRLLLDGEDWKVYPIDNREDTLSLDELDITVVDGDGDEVPDDAYDLVVGTSYWSEEENREVFTEQVEPYGLDDDEENPGFSGYAAYAVAKDGSGYTGQTENRNFMIWHKYSFNYFGANATFGDGDEYKVEGKMSWHDRYAIPADRVEAPVVHGITMEDAIDPAYYELTYFVRHDEVLPEFDPEHPGLVEYDENARYSEKEPLDGMPSRPGTYFVRIEGKEPYYGISYVDFDILPFSFERCELRFRGKEEWAEDYLLDSKDQTLSLSDLGITVVDEAGDALDPSAYELSVGIETGYDDEKDQPVIEWLDGPFGLTTENSRQSGWQMHCVKATAKEGSGYEGDTRIFEFMIRDKHSLERDSVYIDFGEQYLTPAFRSWHYNYEIPVGEMRQPKVFDKMQRLLDDSQYRLTYFKRGADVGYDDPDRVQKIYPEDEPLDGMPEEVGSYFVRLDGQAPYYGKSYVDFDIVDEPECYAIEHETGRKYYDGDTVYLTEGDDVYIGFGMVGEDGVIIPGWRSEMLLQAGFEVDPDPFFFDGDNRAYAHIRVKDARAGTRSTMLYGWYRYDEIFGESGKGWVGAVPLWNCVLNVEVVPAAYSYLLGDADGSGDISVLDVTLIQRKLAKLKTDVDDAVLMRGDVDADGKLEITDAVFIQRWLANLRLPYHVGKPIV